MSWDRDSKSKFLILGFMGIEKKLNGLQRVQKTFESGGKHGCGGACACCSVYIHIYNEMKMKWKWKWMNETLIWGCSSGFSMLQKVKITCVKQEWMYLHLDRNIFHH